VMMANLADHFGEDASMPRAKQEEITAYLERYAAEAWDTRAAQRFKFTSPNEPLSITATPAWQGFHRHLDPAVFSSLSIRARSNCVACHSDADSRRFDPQAISLPP